MPEGFRICVLLAKSRKQQSTCGNSARIVTIIVNLSVPTLVKLFVLGYNGKDYKEMKLYGKYYNNQLFHFCL